MSKGQSDEQNAKTQANDGRAPQEGNETDEQRTSREAQERMKAGAKADPINRDLNAATQDPNKKEETPEQKQAREAQERVAHGAKNEDPYKGQNDQNKDQNK